MILGVQVLRHQLMLGVQDSTYRWWWERIHEYLGNNKPTLEWFEKLSQ